MLSPRLRKDVVCKLVAQRSSTNVRTATLERSCKMNSRVDVAANRRARKWSRREQIARLIWSFAWPLFRLSPRPLWAWRRVILRLFGAQIGKRVHVYPTVRIVIPWNLFLEDDCAIGDNVTLYSLGPIRIGERATVSQGAHICAGTHDIGDPSRPLLKPPISIGNDVWVCADAFVGPGVVVGDGAIIGARAVTMKDVPANAIIVGNPARQIACTKG